ncbi:DUF397 domain-containing protein [Nocardia sp. X0981]
MTNDPTGPFWFKSSRSTPAGECVEVAWLDADQVGVRDSKNPGPTLTFDPYEWSAFTAAIQEGRFTQLSA